MNQKSYYSLTGTIFLVIAIVHLLRILNDWPARINTFTLPMWLSYAAVIVAGYLAYHGLKRKQFYESKSSSTLRNAGRRYGEQDYISLFSILRAIVQACYNHHHGCNIIKTIDLITIQRLNYSIHMQSTGYALAFTHNLFDFLNFWKENIFRSA